MLGLSVTSLPWRSELTQLKARLACVFQRSETREQVGLYLDGLIGGAERKNGWQLAEHVGDEVPWRMQAVLGCGGWDADCARDICRDYVIEQLGDPTGVLVLDETGFVKKGTKTWREVGIQVTATVVLVPAWSRPELQEPLGKTVSVGVILHAPRQLDESAG
jgi:SRSO17 transposase